MAKSAACRNGQCDKCEVFQCPHFCHNMVGDDLDEDFEEVGDVEDEEDDEQEGEDVIE